MNLPFCLQFPADIESVDAGAFQVSQDSDSVRRQRGSEAPFFNDFPRRSPQHPAMLRGEQLLVAWPLGAQPVRLHLRAAVVPHRDAAFVRHPLLVHKGRLVAFPRAGVDVDVSVHLEGRLRVHAHLFRKVFPWLCHGFNLMMSFTTMS